MSSLYCRCASIEMAPLQDETILFDPDRKLFCVLNRTASFLWSQLATPMTTDSLAVRVCESFSGVSAESALRDANRTVEEMLALNFIIQTPVGGQ
jgi:Coenzyme PQQ synthesis protein D (PqqD)